MIKPNKHLLDVVRWGPLYSDGNHNAFTSLTWYRGQPYVAFRQGSTHGSWDGRDLVLRGTVDGERWQIMAALPPAQTGSDARDPKLLATPEELFCYLPVRIKEGDQTGLRTECCFSEDGERWTSAEEVLPGWFLFWVKWVEGRAYAVAYDRSERRVMFFRSMDGRQWEKVSVLAESEREGGVNEAAFDFASDGTCWAVVRSDLEECHPLLAYARPPYTRWETQELELSIKANCLWLVGDQVYFSGRWFPTADFRAMAVFRVKDKEPDLTLVLPGGGDLSYMSVAPHPEDPLRWWLVYYSSHRYSINMNGNDMPADIFIAEVRFLEEEQEW